MKDTSFSISFAYHPMQKRLFRTAGLWKKWRRQYPNLFDADDEHNAETQASRGYHFYEWLAAIVIFHTTGWLSLVEKYQFKKHARKQLVLQKLGAIDSMERLLEARTLSEGQLPDLLVYEPDYSNWLFCEVKGEKDRLRKSQKSYFVHLHKVTHRPVIIARFSTDYSETMQEGLIEAMTRFLRASEGTRKT